MSQKSSPLPLNCHFKILPDIEWFEKAVEAGKHEILQKYGSDILNGVSVTYVNDIEKAIEKLTEVKTDSNELQHP
ncbi:MAG: hypothetical protein E6Q37_07480 [Crocinitomicaceae bacterium]|nr:MAG: hypothetical protein E6Q37_07480 [Crocinitomicaceae bacterium]